MGAIGGVICKLAFPASNGGLSEQGLVLVAIPVLGFDFIATLRIYFLESRA